MRPLEPAGSGGAATAPLGASPSEAFTGLAALDSVADFAVLRVEGKLQFYQSATLGYSSLDKHAVPIRVEAVVSTNRMFVSLQDPLAPSERGHQHQQRGLWQVEVGHHCAGDAELESRIDEDIGLADLCHDAAIFILSHGKLKCADGCRPHRNDTPPGVARSLNAFRCLL